MSKRVGGQTAPTQPSGSHRRDRRVIPITPDVRSVLGLYLTLFRNYEEAAEAVGVSKDTVAKYFEGNPNVAYYVFERMTAVLRERVSAEKIRDYIPNTSFEEILATAHERNGQQIDNVMYEISKPVLKVLQFYTEQFPSRARAAHRLDVNPRTFKAYLKGDIRSFPRSKWLEMVEVLEEKGFGEKEVCRVAGVANWDELLSARVRLETLNLSERDVRDAIKALFEDGQLKNNQIEKRLRNAANRIYGNFGNAVRATFKELEEDLIARIAADVEKGDFTGAFREIRRLERYIRLYAAKERAVNRSSGPAAKKRWREDVLEISKRKNGYKEKVFKALRLKATPESDSLPESADELKVYDPAAGYVAGDVLVHPEYGLGHVLRLDGERQFVITFGPRVGEKTLVMNQKSGGPEFWRLAAR